MPLPAAMIDRTPPPPSSPPPSRRGAPRARASEAELAAVVQRAAGVADGLAFLEGAPLESAAVRLGVAPTAIERVRSLLQDSAAREAVLRLVTHATHRPEAEPAAPARPAPRDADALVAAAEARPGGLALLLGACLECAAIAFGVHPDLVHAARELAVRRGFSQDLPPDAEE